MFSFDDDCLPDEVLAMMDMPGARAPLTAPAAPGPQQGSSSEAAAGPAAARGTGGDDEWEFVDR